jgi:hypothetical protein
MAVYITSWLGGLEKSCFFSSIYTDRYTQIVKQSERKKKLIKILFAPNGKLWREFYENIFLLSSLRDYNWINLIRMFFNFPTNLLVGSLVCYEELCYSLLIFCSLFSCLEYVSHENQIPNTGWKASSVVPQHISEKSIKIFTLLVLRFFRWFFVYE